MNKSLLIGLIVGAGATAGMGALASLAFKNNQEAPPTILAPAQSAAPATDEAQIGNTGEESLAFSPADLPEAVDAFPEAEAPPPIVEKPVRAQPKYARVVSAEPITRSVSEPREVCREVEVTQQAPVRDEHQVAGTVIGGVIGGVIGNQVGDGRGRKIAKIAGALGGAYAGNKVQERIQNNRTVTATETKCETVYDSREVPDGYRVTYEWNGSTRTVNMPSDPGSRLPVRGGEVILTANAG
jgi:uncharacterized protein YcfJ